MDISQSGKDLLVCGAKGEFIDLRRRDPSEIVVFQQPGLPFPDEGVEQGKMDREVRIFVYHVHKNVSGFNFDGQLFRTLPYQRLGGRFAIFHFPSHKLPEEVQVFLECYRHKQLVIQK